MDDGRHGPTGRRKFLTLAGGILLVGAAGVAGAAALRSEDAPGPDPQRVRTDPEPLDRRFGTALGPLSDAHWIGYDVDAAQQDSRIGPPAPDSRVRLVGLARLRPGGAAAVLATPGHTFTPAPLTGLPARLEPYVPAGAVWRGSAEFDRTVTTGDPSAEATGGFRFDEAHDLVCFDLLYLYT